MKKFFSLLLILSLFVVLLTSCSSGGGKYEIPEAPPCYVQLEKNGENYEVYAVQGQVWLLFDSSVTPQYAEQILAENNAKILDVQPEVNCYLAEVQVGTEGEFVASMRKYQEVEYVYPNAIRQFKAARPYVLDIFEKHSDEDIEDFEINHGVLVVDMLEKSSLKKMRGEDKFDVELIITPEDDVDDWKVKSAMRKIFASNQSSNSVVINMSFGVGMESLRWKRASFTERRNFKRGYIDEIVGMVRYTRQYYERKRELEDFVIIKAAGNEGVPHLEEFIDGVCDSLSREEEVFFYKHFLLVSAKDDNVARGQEYSNVVSSGHFNEMVSTTDISDKTISEDTIWNGTSFSSPRLAGYIVRAADSYNKKVTEVLKFVRKATKRAPNHVIDYEMLANEIESSRGFVDLGLPSGTLWKGQNEPGYYTYEDALSKFGTLLPTARQCHELDDNCDWAWTGNGYTVTGPNGNSIFLPAMGYVEPSGEKVSVGIMGYYLSSDLQYSMYPFTLSFNPGQFILVTAFMENYFWARSVRLVR